MVSGSVAPSRCRNRLRATALIPRQTATLGLSTPSPGDTSGRSGDGARELDTGTTTSSSSGTLALMSSTETTTTGRFFPGSPLRAAPNETSHSSPRRGSVDAIGQGRLPLALLSLHARGGSVAPRGVPLGTEDRIPLGPTSNSGQHGRERHAPLTRLLREQVTSLPRDSDGHRLSHSSHGISLRWGDTTCLRPTRGTGRPRAAADVRPENAAVRSESTAVGAGGGTEGPNQLVLSHPTRTLPTCVRGSRSRSTDSRSKEMWPPKGPPSRSKRLRTCRTLPAPPPRRQLSTGGQMVVA